MHESSKNTPKVTVVDVSARTFKRFLSNKLIALLVVGLIGVGGMFTVLHLHALSTTYYVSRTGNNADGTSWSTAWNELSQINWSVIQPGDTIMVDGGSTACNAPYEFTTTRPGVNCGMEYDTPLTIAKSGTSTAPIIIKLSTEIGRNGTAVFFGGRGAVLPYCHQTSYTATAVRQYGILVNGAYHDVVVDGSHRSGITINGAVQGVRIASGSGAYSLTFKQLEVFDNGSITTSSGGGYRSDSEGFSLGAGKNVTIKGSIIHDNGQDGIQDETRSAGTLDGLVLDTNWIYNRRSHPTQAGEPFNDLQRVGDNTCTHNDGIQLYSGGASESGVTVKDSLFGPLVNQGVYLGDSSLGTKWTNVNITNSLFLAVSHNIQADLAVHGWTVDHSTLFAPQGGTGIPSDGANVLSGVIKHGGYFYAPAWSGTTSSNTWWLGDPLPGTSTNANPNFTATPAGTLPSYDSYAIADFTPSCASCSTAGSNIHKFADILTKIDSMSSSPTDPTPPSVAVSGITNGSTISGSVPVGASASDASGIARVEFYLDGNLYKSEASPPYCMAGDNGTCFGWDSSTVGNGTHTIAAKAYDNSGNTATSSVSFNVSNVDSTAPTAPAGLTGTATSTNQINLSWSVSTDNVGVAGYNILRNGTKIASTTGASYSDTSVLAGTSYAYVVTAYDAAGNTSAASNSATVATPPATVDTTKPVVTISQPKNNQIVKGTITVSASATDNVGVVRTEIYIDGTLYASTQGSSITTNWNTKRYSRNSKHTITVNAYDAAGNKATTTITVTKG